MARSADTGDLPLPTLADRARSCAHRIRAADEVLLVSHIDADGLTSAAIAARALERAGIPFEVEFAKQLDAKELAKITAAPYDTVLFTDFGSGQLGLINEYETAGEFTPVIVDHHQPADASTEYHLNPLLEGIDGADELSGAGTTYLLARALEDNEDNRDLAALAVVGAVGDMQASTTGLHGANESIVAEGTSAGVIQEQTDITLYGRQTRPLPKLLEYASEARIPGISNDPGGTVEFLADLDIDLKDSEGDWRRWVDLTAEERQAVVSALVRRAVSRGVPASRVNDLVGTTYILTREEPGTELRDVSEFSTLLNATARYDRADVGLAVCLGDRSAALTRARKLLRTHRRNLSEGLNWVTNEGVTTEENLQWFDAEDRIRETIVGIVAGMAIGADGISVRKPIIAFATKGSDDLKVSARGSTRLVHEGLDLSTVMQEAARAVGGDGGGHDVAAGATIPQDQRDAFLDLADRLIGDQLPG